jgi:hypothetical protein
MNRPSDLRLAQISIGVLLLVIVRSLGEYFRLQYLHGQALVIAQVTPYVAGALFAAVALGLTVTLPFRRSPSGSDCYRCRNCGPLVRLQSRGRGLAASVSICGTGWKASPAQDSDRYPGCNARNGVDLQGLTRKRPSFLALLEGASHGTRPRREE